MAELKACKNCGGQLIQKATKRTSEQLKKSYYYTAYYFCPNCKKLYHDEKFKMVNTDLFSVPVTPSAARSEKDYDAHIWTDGASRNNGTDNARAAWAFVAKQSASGGSSGKMEMAGRVIGKQTNNTAEAFAIYHALLWAAEEKKKRVKIYTDSQITLHGLAKSPERVKENREIFQLIQDVISANGLEVDYEKVPAHADNINNNRADRLANELAGIKNN